MPKLTLLGPQCRCETFFVHKAWVLFGYNDPDIHEAKKKLGRNNRKRIRRAKERQGRRLNNANAGAVEEGESGHPKEND